jgi:hypothetical protein
LAAANFGSTIKSAALRAITPFLAFKIPLGVRLEVRLKKFIYPNHGQDCEKNSH